MQPGKTHLIHLGCGFMVGGSIFFALCHEEHGIKDGLVRGDYRRGLESRGQINARSGATEHFHKRND